jgi:hypothetical protein
MMLIDIGNFARLSATSAHRSMSPIHRRFGHKNFTPGLEISTAESAFLDEGSHAAAPGSK